MEPRFCAIRVRNLRRSLTVTAQAPLSGAHNRIWTQRMSVRLLFLTLFWLNVRRDAFFVFWFIISKIQHPKATRLFQLISIEQTEWAVWSPHISEKLLMLFSKWLTRCIILPYCYTHTHTHFRYAVIGPHLHNIHWLCSTGKKSPFSEHGWGDVCGGGRGILDDDFREIVHILFKFSLNGSKTPCRVIGSDLFVDLLGLQLAFKLIPGRSLGYERSCRSSCVIVQRTIFSNAA